MDGGASWAAVHGVAKSRTRLSDFTFSFHFHALEKEMATHSSVLAWRITGTEEPGGLPSMGSHRVGHDWSNLAAAAARIDYLGSPWQNIIVIRCFVDAVKYLSDTKLPVNTFKVSENFSVTITDCHDTDDTFYLFCSHILYFSPLNYNLETLAEL